MLSSWKSYKVHNYGKKTLHILDQNSDRKMNVEDPNTVFWKLVKSSYLLYGAEIYLVVLYR